MHKKTLLLFIFLAAIRVLFMVTFPPNLGGDSIKYFNLILSGKSNLIHASGYPYLMGLPFRFLLSKEIAHRPNEFCYILMFFQHVISYSVLFLFFRELRRYGFWLAALVVVFLTAHHGMLQANSQIYPEWLQTNLLILLLIFLHRASLPASTPKIKPIFYLLVAAVILTVSYLVKYNSIYWLSLFMVCLFSIRGTFKAKLGIAISAGAIASALVYSYALFVHFPSTGTMTLSEDKAWVLLTKVGLFVHKADPNVGPNTQRLLVLNSILPWDNKNLYAVGHVREVAPDVADYRSKYLHLLTADKKTLTAYDDRLKLPEPYDFNRAWSPPCYYLGLPEGNKLGVKVFLEHILYYWKEYGFNILELTTESLSGPTGIVKFPTTLGASAGQMNYGFYRLDMSGTNGAVGNGGDSYYNKNFVVWKPGLYFFKALIFIEDCLPNVLIVLLVLLNFVGTCRSVFKVRALQLWESYILTLTPLALGFILFSNSILSFRSDKELVALMPLVSLLFAKALVDGFSFSKLWINKYQRQRPGFDQKT